MSRENVAVVERAIAAFNERDINGYLACCTEDIRFQSAWAAVEGVYEGPDAIRRYFDDIHGVAPDVRLDVERLEAIGADRVLAYLHYTATMRTSGLRSDSLTAVVYTLANGKISRVRVFRHRQEALEAVGRE
jgi:ketosteroid isomerase-like protein